MENKIKKIDLSQDMYGIHMELITKYEGGSPKNYLDFTFNVKRKGILKRWDLIESQLPDLGIIQVTAELVRFIETISLSDLRERSYGKNYKYICQSTIAEAIEFDPNERCIEPNKISIKSRDKRRLINVRTGEFNVGEMLGVTISIPFMFCMNIREEMDKILELRKMIYALNSVIVATERVKLLKGDTLLPEYEAEELTNMITKGNPYGIDEFRDDSGVQF